PIRLQLRKLRAVDDDDLRTAARARGADDVGCAIAVDVGDRHAHAAAERRGEGEEIADDGAGGSQVNDHLRRRAGVDANGEVLDLRRRRRRKHGPDLDAADVYRAVDNAGGEIALIDGR